LARKPSGNISYIIIDIYVKNYQDALELTASGQFPEFKLG